MFVAAVVITFGEVGKARAGRGRNSRRKLQEIFAARADFSNLREPFRQNAKRARGAWLYAKASQRGCQ
jgi:hypothetical protein